MKILVGVLTTILVVLYPIAIWFGLTHLSARTVSLWMLAAVVPGAILRFRRSRREDLLALLRIPLAIFVVLGLGALLDDGRFVLATPVLINLALFATFAVSMRSTPMIERFARMHEPGEFSRGQAAHCRQVTVAWVVFFLANASIAALLALSERADLWALYNGGIAYVLMGMLFVGEYVLRQYRFRKYGSGLRDRLLSRIFPPPVSDEPVFVDEPVSTEEPVFTEEVTEP